MCVKETEPQVDIAGVGCWLLWRMICVQSQQNLPLKERMAGEWESKDDGGRRMYFGRHVGAKAILMALKNRSSSSFKEIETAFLAEIGKYFELWIYFFQSAAFRLEDGKTGRETFRSVSSSFFLNDNLRSRSLCDRRISEISKDARTFPPLFEVCWNNPNSEAVRSFPNSFRSAPEPSFKFRLGLGLFFSF